MDIDSKKSIFESLDERSAAGVLVPMDKTDKAALDHVGVKITLSVNSRNSDSNNSATIARFEQRLIKTHYWKHSKIILNILNYFF